MADFSNNGAACMIRLNCNSNSDILRLFRRLRGRQFHIWGGFQMKHKLNKAETEMMFVKVFICI